MKLKVTISDMDKITLNFNDNSIRWLQHTNGSIEWAGQIANKISYLFPEYKLKTFSFVPSLKSGYVVTVEWHLS